MYVARNSEPQGRWRPLPAKVPLSRAVAFVTPFPSSQAHAAVAQAPHSPHWNPWDCGRSHLQYQPVINMPRLTWRRSRDSKKAQTAGSPRHGRGGNTVSWQPWGGGASSAQEAPSVLVLAMLRQMRSTSQMTGFLFGVSCGRGRRGGWWRSATIRPPRSSLLGQISVGGCERGGKCELTPVYLRPSDRESTASRLIREVKDVPARDIGGFRVDQPHAMGIVLRWWADQVQSPGAVVL